MNLKTDNFKTCVAALSFIDELKKKNTKCDGKLNNTPKKVMVINGKTGKKKEEIEYTWHVTYDADLLKTKEEKK